MQEARFRFFMTTAVLLQTALLIVLLIRLPVADTDNTRMQTSGLSPAIANTGNDADLDQRLQAIVQQAVRAELAALKHDTAGSAKIQQDIIPSQNFDTGEWSDEAASSSAIITQAISSGRWTQKNTRDLLTHLPKISESERMQLVEQLYDAINRQQLDMEDFPPL